ncbi:MAG: DUF2333 family protein [Desulfobacterales bacterium]
MEEINNREKDNKSGYFIFAATRIVIGITFAVAVLWVFDTLLGHAEKNLSEPVVQTEYIEKARTISKAMETAHEAPSVKETSELKEGASLQEQPTLRETEPAEEHVTVPETEPVQEDTAVPETEPVQEDTAVPETEPVQARVTVPEIEPAQERAMIPETEPAKATTMGYKPVTEEPKTSSKIHEALVPKVSGYPDKGMAFIEAVIKPLDYELHQRFWGWRPNDALNLTDNVGNFQLGVLEVTRRTVEVLTERISRADSTATFDTNLESAMNWLMVKADQFRSPSAESKYSAGLDEIRTYREKLEKREADFNARTDNLISLLTAYEDLLGSCEESLIKAEEEDGSPVSFFKADDYFFYSKGVASAMYTILEATTENFNTILESQQAIEVLHNAIESLQNSIEVEPLIITNSNLSGIFANHRANIAMPISHARYSLKVLIKILST